MRVTVRIAVVVTLFAMLGSKISSAQSCIGDCDGTGEVTVNELLILVNIALGNAQTSACPHGVLSSAEVDISLIIQAVNNALLGCVRVTPTPSPSPSDLVEQGLNALAANNLRDANDFFEAALSLYPTDARAVLMEIFTRIARVLLENSRLRSLATRAGISITGDSTNVCEFELSVPSPLLAGAPRTGEIMEAVRVVLLPELARAAQQLRDLPKSVEVWFSAEQLPECVRDYVPSARVRVNHADVMAMAACFDAIIAVYDLVAAYNVDADFETILHEPLPNVLASELAFLTLLPGKAGQIRGARDRLDGALQAIVAAVDTVRGREDELEDHVLGYLVGTGGTARKAKRVIDLARQAMWGEVEVPIDIVTGQVVLLDIGLVETERVNLSRLFTGQVGNLRLFVPSVDEDGDLDFTTVPDPTFGGLTPTLTTHKIANFLRGGPACGECTDDSDCNAFGFGSFECSPCTENCTASTSTRRCVKPFEPTQCSDGTYGSLISGLTTFPGSARSSLLADAKGAMCTEHPWSYR